MLADVELPFTQRTIPFGSEALGFLSSRFYVQSLIEQGLKNTKAILNFPALATGSGVNVLGDGDITEIVSAVGGEIGVNVAVTRSLTGGSSDFTNFRYASASYLTYEVCTFVVGDASRIHAHA